MQNYLLAIDEGTTSTRAVIFDLSGKVCASHQISLKQYFLNDAWIEHDPLEIWESTLLCCKTAIEKAGISAKKIAAIGITNQRETTIIWDRKTGKPIYPAIVWQDRRTQSRCKLLSDDKNISASVLKKTGLIIDPYFSATKISWILDHVPDARKRAKKGELAFGTIDTYLLWQLTNGNSFYTDATNASRTMIFNIHTQSWDDELLSLFDIPAQLLPTVLDSNAHFGITQKTVLGAEIPITGIAGDQQAATIGQACFETGMMKATYGTGCFVVLNTGNEAILSHNRLLTTIAYRINNQVTYALEGSIFCAGAVMQWLRDNLKFFTQASESEKIIANINHTNGVYFVPAFTGLGAPHWNPTARAALVGMTRDTEIPHIVRAALESVCYQTADLLFAMKEDFEKPFNRLHVDGGMSENNWLLQYLSNVLQLPVMRPKNIETTALGAAFLAALGSGIFRNLSDISKLISEDKVFIPTLSAASMENFYQGWKKAIQRVL